MGSSCLYVISASGGSQSRVLWWTLPLVSSKTSQIENRTRKESWNPLLTFLFDLKDLQRVMTTALLLFQPAQPWTCTRKGIQRHAIPILIKLVIEQSTVCIYIKCLTSITVTAHHYCCHYERMYCPIEKKIKNYIGICCMVKQTVPICIPHPCSRQEIIWFF